ncbi:helix-turn-helix transcriptional regulator [Pseudoclavibacter sp. 13-3]|uniref:helix-turn-helix transcriptional regulator n=1 Tax=Pseudoclavibacter sp. 13-3 TaxID=2901228 RepID=UPI001E607DD0|nr:LuxR C-terminal-related transcriptional regulator [Pseudoclavibacter sp. 13-3]MCD7101257.1 LuxR C-terminal-related transcriptional regulator [Pseudoclavibacter sp. 13-3]
MLLHEWLTMLAACPTSPNTYIAAPSLAPDELDGLEAALVASHADYRKVHGTDAIRRDVVLVIDGWPASPRERAVEWLTMQMRRHPWLGAVVTTRSSSLAERVATLLGGSVNVITSDLLAFSEKESRQLYANVTGQQPLAGSRFSELPYLTLQEARRHTSASDDQSADPRPLARALVQSTLMQTTTRPLRDELIVLCALGTVNAAAMQSAPDTSAAFAALQGLGLSRTTPESDRLSLVQAYSSVFTGYLPGVSSKELRRTLTWYGERCAAAQQELAAFEAFLAAGELARATRLVTEMAPALINREFGEITRLLGQLSSAQLSEQPLLCALYASGLFWAPGKQHQAGALLSLALNKAARALDDAQTPDITDTLYWNLIRMIALRLGFLDGDTLTEVAAIKRIISQHRAELMQTKVKIMVEFLERSAEAELLRGRPDQAVKTIEHDVPPLDADGARGETIGHAVCANAHLALGNRSRAAACMPSSRGLQPVIGDERENSLIVLSALYSANELIEATQYAEAQTVLNDYSDVIEAYDGVHLGAHAWAMLAICQNRVADGLLELEELRLRIQGTRPMNRYSFAQFRLAEAELTLADGRPRAATRIMQQVAADLPRLSRNLFLARAALCRRDLDRANTILNETAEPRAADSRHRIELALLTAAARLSKQGTHSGKQQLHKAAFLLDRTDLTLPLVRLDSQSRNRLLAFCTTSDDPLMSKLRARAEGLPVLLQLEGPAADDDSCPELTERERIVLTELAEAKGPVQIAERLSVSVNTVKSQVRSLYRKLGVHGRDEAVAAASRLRLIDVPAR